VIARAAAPRSLLPALTCARILAVPAVMALILAGPDHDSAYTAAAVVFAVAASTDFVDGYLARRWSVTTKLGSFLDTTADKLLVSGALIALVDVGRARVDSPRIDFAAAIWSLQYSFGAGFGQMFLDAYGTPPMTDREIERLRRSYSRR